MDDSASYRQIPRINNDSVHAYDKGIQKAASRIHIIVSNYSNIPRLIVLNPTLNLSTAIM